MGTWMVGYQHPYSRRVHRSALGFWAIYGQAWLWDFYVVYKTRKNAPPEDHAKWRGHTLSEYVASLLANPRTGWLVALGLGWNVAHFVSLARHLRRGTAPGPLGMPFKNLRHVREPQHSESARYAMDNLGTIGWL